MELEKSEEGFQLDFCFPFLFYSFVLCVYLAVCSYTCRVSINLQVSLSLFLFRLSFLTDRNFEAELTAKLPD